MRTRDTRNGDTYRFVVGPRHIAPLAAFIILSVVLVYAAYAEVSAPAKPADWNVCKPIKPSETDWDTLTEGMRCLYFNEKDKEKALQLAKKLLEIAERDFGPEHSNTAQSLNNLAVILWNQKRYSEAEPLFRRMLTIIEKNYGGSLQGYLSNVARFYEEQKKYSIAEAYREKELYLDEQKHPPRSLELTSSLYHLAFVYMKRKKYSAALSLYKRYLRIAKDNPSVYEHMADIYMAQGRYSKALRTYELSLKTADKVGGISAELLEKMSKAHTRMSKMYSRRAQIIRKENEPTNKE